MSMEKFSGTVEALGMSIFMQGTHQLTDDKGNQVALLQSDSDQVNLGSFEGKKVEISGIAEPAVEGGATFVNVHSISVL